MTCVRIIVRQCIRHFIPNTLKVVTMRNPILEKGHEAHASKLSKRFPALNPANDHHILALWKYVEKRPYRFFSEFAFEVFLRELLRLDCKDHSALRKLIVDNIGSIDNAYREIEEINDFPWHDEPMQGKDDYRNLMLINQNLNPAYLRLTESVLKPLLTIPAYFSRINRGKSTEKLELYDISDELRNTDFQRLLQPYEAVVRNAIAHGGVIYRANSICFTDKKGNSKEFRDTELIRIFDDLLDVCNGMVAAISGFLLVQSDVEYPRPQHLLLEDLRTETQTPYWTVAGWLPSKQINGSQLIVYVGVQTLDYDKAVFSSFQTAILAERLRPGYDRYFLSLSQPKGMRGFGAFDGTKLAAHRERSHEFGKYSDVLEKTGLFFIPHVKLPKILRKIGSLWLIFRVYFELAASEYREKLGLCRVVVRDAQIHRNAWGVVLNADVVLEREGEQVEQAHVRRQSKAIIRKSLREARRKKSYFNLSRYLPLGYARVHLFQKDYRRRRLVNFGLAKDLVGTIQIKRIRRIKAPDIAGSTIEQIRSVRIAWNHRWLEQHFPSDAP